MKHGWTLIPALALMAGCATIPDENAIAKATERAISLELATTARCAFGPLSPTEAIAQTAARLLFVGRYGPFMTAGQTSRYNASVDRTNIACGTKPGAAALG